MTEQEFRNVLKRQVGQTGLSSDRQYQVLAGMKGGERKVKMRSKFKITMVIAAVLVFSMGAAVATELIQGVTWLNWNGESVAYTPQRNVEHEPVLEHPVELKTAQQAAIDNKAVKEFIVASYKAPRMSSTAFGHVRTSAASVGELAEMIGSNSLLPVPVWIPEEYTLVESDVWYDCLADGRFERDEVITQADGITVERYLLEEDKLFINHYWLTYEDAQGNTLKASALYRPKSENAPFGIVEGTTVRTLKIEGMDNALLYEDEDGKIIVARFRLPEAVCVLDMPETYFAQKPVYKENQEIMLQIRSDVLDADTMLAIFGLTAK